MAELKGLVVETPSYQELVGTTEEMKEQGLTGHRVVWETEERSHDATQYVVKEFDSHLGDPTLLIWGRGGNKETGGKYEIVPKPDSPAWIRYYYPDGRTRDEELTRLAVFSPDFAYAQKQGWHVFLQKPFEILEQLRD
jgi:hypothetical protein